MNEKGGCWPPSGPPAATNQVFLILMWMLAPSKASGGKKSSICVFDLYIAVKLFLTCGNDRSRQIIAKSRFKNEKLALCVELLPKHSQKKTWSQCCILSFSQTLI